MPEKLRNSVTTNVNQKGFGIRVGNIQIVLAASGNTGIPVACSILDNWMSERFHGRRIVRKLHDESECTAWLLYTRIFRLSLTLTLRVEQHHLV